MTNEPPASEPPSHNTVNSFIVVDGAAEFIKFLTAVFDATENPDAHSPDFYADDGTLIHAEVSIGNSTIMLADRKPDWPFTPALTQVYVTDAQQTLLQATAHGATIVTEVSAFYGGYDIARFLDPWHNVWWLFAPARDGEATSQEWDESTWEEPSEPSAVYTTILDTMQNLTDPSTARVDTASPPGRYRA